MGGLSQAAQLPRRLELDGTYNFRDVGGYPTRSGATVRWRTLYRADSLHRLSAAARKHLIDAGLKTVVDLRRPAETEHSPGVFAASADIHYVNIVLKPGSAEGEWEIPEDERFNLPALYRRMVDTATEGIRDAVSVLATPGAFPAVLHCTAGKDRTGIIIALLLDSAGVAREDTVSDYAMSADYLTGRYFEEARERAERAGIPWEKYRLLLDAPETAIASLLQHVEERYGGSTSYLHSIGVAEASLRGLHEALLDHNSDRKGGK